MTDEIKGLVTRLIQMQAGLLYESQRTLLGKGIAALTLSDEARVRAEETAEYLRGFAKSETEAVAYYHDCAVKARAAFEASEALVRELVEGLRPFGDAAPTLDGLADNWPIKLVPYQFAAERDKLPAADFRKVQALILRAGNLGSSVVESAALLAPQANCSAAQSNLDWAPGPFASVYPADGRRVLLLASYCGEDNPKCSDERPCNDCLAMDNVALVRGQMKVLGGLDYMAAQSLDGGEG